MTRVRDGKVLVVLLVALVAAVLLSFASCSEEPEPNYAKEAVEANQRLSEVAQHLAEQKGEATRHEAELKATRAQLSASEARADERAKEARLQHVEHQIAQEQTEAAESDFLAAAGITFSLVLVALLLVGLLLRERRQRRILVRFVRWLKREGEQA